MTIALGAWWEAPSNRTSDRKSRGLKEWVVAVHAPMLVHRLALAIRDYLT
jgi:hypothetical protein